MFLLTVLFSLLSNALAGEVTLVNRWKTTLDTFQLGYTSKSFTIVNNTIYVINGADVGNAVLQFDMEGNYLTEFPGWFNFPVELVVGGRNADQVLLSAIGAMGDNHQMRFGMVMYQSSGEFFHGYHEADTGLVRPYGLARVPDSDMVAVCDWDNNRTVLLDIDWEEGTVVLAKELASLPYPFDMAITRERIVVISNVCCEEWHEAMKVMRIYSLDTNSVLAEVKELPTGETITNPGDVTVTEEGDRILLSDQDLDKTIIFDMDGNYRGEMEGLPFPEILMFHSGLLYSLTTEDNEELGLVESFINVYTYSW